MVDKCKLDIPDNLPKKDAITYARMEDAGLLENTWEVAAGPCIDGCVKVKTTSDSGATYYFVVPSAWRSKIQPTVTPSQRFRKWYKERYTEENKKRLKAGQAEASMIWVGAIMDYRAMQCEDCPDSNTAHCINECKHNGDR